MVKNAIRVSTDADQEEVAKTLQELDLLAIPVVDKENRLVGIVTVDDAMDVLEEEATEDILDHAGFAGSDEANRSEVLIKGSLWKIWRVRLPFLLATLVLGMISGLVIDGFEETLEAITAVAIFIPLIMGMGGNIGTQSSTVFVRGVVLGHIQTSHFIKPFIKEIGVGLSIGLLVGVISGVVAAIWLQMPMLGLAVGLAMVVTMTVAALLGYLVPYILIKLNADQAAGSAPIITTLKDLVALVIYFACVTAFLGHML
jgi:magnesium transporter